MTKKPDRTVYQRPADKKWVDRRNDADRGFVHDTQKDAIQSAKEKITNQGGGELTVKGRDGKIRSKDSVGGGNDPNPPKDKEH
ncbi:DUF2188 domain-containing protein [Mesorhizobium sp. L2C084A000]|uniref:DUF2188 domain-containing protein n=1 Tax=Mesorhizobium TaxID=68287 RepID=UPI0003CFAC82|nr:DUF2188 domain-containing protein [Mesorhizobium sp. L2C084A000]ESZ22875.1 hypothetical protein X734_28930 [Mesorhizobium sp. L2C084A000]